MKTTLSLSQSFLVLLLMLSFSSLGQPNVLSLSEENNFSAQGPFPGISLAGNVSESNISGNIYGTLNDFKALIGIIDSTAYYNNEIPEIKDKRSNVPMFGINFNGKASENFIQLAENKKLNPALGIGMEFAIPINSLDTCTEIPHKEGKIYKRFRRNLFAGMFFKLQLKNFFNYDTLVSSTNIETKKYNEIGLGISFTLIKDRSYAFIHRMDSTPSYRSSRKRIFILNISQMKEDNLGDLDKKKVNSITALNNFNNFSQNITQERDVFVGKYQKRRNLVFSIGRFTNLWQFASKKKSKPSSCYQHFTSPSEKESQENAEKSAQDNSKAIFLGLGFEARYAETIRPEYILHFSLNLLDNPNDLFDTNRSLGRIRYQMGIGIDVNITQQNAPVELTPQLKTGITF